MRKALVACAALWLARGAWACDICAVYTAMEAKEAKPGLFAGVFEQWSDFATLQEDGEELDNDQDQKLRSSITQVFAGYQFNHRFGVQVTVPYIDRSFRRAEHDGVETGSESGIGDLSVLAHVRLFESLSQTTLVAWSVTGGLELPTGDSDRLGEELEEDHDEGEGPLHPATPGLIALPLPHEDHGAPSGVHGHDLALGSGSVDGLLGTSLAWRHNRWFGVGAAQYAARTEGDFDYRYADEVTWEVQVGGYLSLEHENTLSLALRLSGEKKGEDELDGEQLDDTAIEAVYCGPQLAFSRGRSFYTDVAVELPLRQENSGVQLVPDGEPAPG